MQVEKCSTFLSLCYKNDFNKPRATDHVPELLLPSKCVSLVLVQKEKQKGKKKKKKQNKKLTHNFVKRNSDCLSRQRNVA